MKRRIFIKTSLWILFFALASIAGANEKIRIACVGDSITAGSGIKNPQMDSYPALLSEMLGGAYDVRNFGASGRTMLKRGDNPYWNDGKFRQAKDFKPNIVIFKLGTNDSRMPNWELKDEFKRDMLEMIADFQELESAPEVWLCTPAPIVRPDSQDRNAVIRDEIVPIVREIAKEKGLKLVDFNSDFAGDPKLFTADGVHPNEVGAMKMAALLYRTLTGKDAPKLEEPRGKISEQDGFKRVDFPFQGRSIVCLLPKTQNGAKEWVWIVENFAGLSERNRKDLEAGRLLVWADASIWWGSPSSLRWAFDFYTHIRMKFDISGQSALEASGIGALFALYWANDSIDKVSSVYLRDPVCDLSKFPDRNNEKQLDEFLKKWRISRQELDDPKTNILNDLSKILNAGIKIEIAPDAMGKDAKTLEDAVKKASAK